MSGARPWPMFAYLDALKPDPGYTVELALLSTYSADVTAIAAAMLALSGRHDDRGGGSAADFVQAVDALGGKLRIVLQRGRLSRPAKLPKIAGLLDRFLIEAPFDESVHSWHAKLALVRYRASDPDAAGGGAVKWRLWLGSRNLTRSQDLDLGLMLESRAGRPGRVGAAPPGIGELGRRLAVQARLSAAEAGRIGRQLDALRWTAPAEITVNAVKLLSGQQDAAYPPPPGPIRELIVVSPFLCPRFLLRAASWGDAATQRTLVSIPASLQAMAHHPGQPLAKYRLLAYDAPVQDRADGADESDQAADQATHQATEQDREPAPLSLHAKLCAFRQERATVLWMGSANATERAWSGRNVEAVAELSLRGEHDAGLDALMGQARPLDLEQLRRQPAASALSAQERLEASRRHLIAHWHPRLQRDGDAFVLHADAPPSLPHGEHRLEAGLATADAWRPWPDQASSLDLGEFPLALHTQFVQLRICDAEGDIDCAWLQKLELQPPLDPQRDRAAIGRHLGPVAFLAWLRAMLQGDPGAHDGEPWDRDPERAAARRWVSEEHDALCLEDILSAWARQPERAFAELARQFGPMLGAVLQYSEALDPSTRAQLHELGGIWSKAMQVLTPGGRP